MKISYCFSALVLFILFSCNKDTELTWTKSKGIIKAQGVSTYMYGTHVLTDDSGGTQYALRSEVVDLNKYIDKKVEVKGHIVKGYPVDGGPKYLEVSKVK